MKRLISCIVLFFVFLSIFAGNKFIVGTGNDKFTYGLSKNEDDLKTFSLSAEIISENIDVRFDYDSFTNRGSLQNNKFTKGRIDSAVLQASYSFCFPYFSLEPILGCGMTGNFGSEFIQNLNHRFNSVEPININYDQTTPDFHFLCGLKADAFVEKGTFGFSAGAEITYLTGLSVISEIRMTADYKNCFKLYLGLESNKEITDSKTLKEATDSLKGLKIGFNLLADFLEADWYIYPQTEMGYGTFSFDLISAFDRYEGNGCDAFYKYAASKIFDMDSTDTSLEILVNKDFSVMFDTEYVSGFPTGARASFRSQRNYSLFTVGMSYHPFDWFIKPYISASTGFGKFEINYIYENPNDCSKDELNTLYASVSDLRLGADIKVKKNLLAGAFAGLRIFPSSDALTDYISKDFYHSADWEASVMSFFYGISLKFGISNLR